MNRIVIPASVALTLLSACSQTQVAGFTDNRHNYYGRNGWYQNGNAVPRYSDNNRADQGDIAYKYQSETHSYGVDASVPVVAVTELAPPAAAAQASPAPAPFALASDDTAPHAASIASRPVVTEQVVKATAAPSAKVEAVNGANIALRWPTEGKIVSRFGPKTDGLSNDGINIAAANGDPIWAAADGEVAYVGNQIEGYGNLLILRHRDGWMTSYAHAKEFLLNKGDTVTQGDVLGYVGNSGSVKTPQLHFSVREGKIPIDPESVLSRDIASVHGS